MFNLGIFFSSLFWKFVVEENMIKRDKFVSIMDLIFFFSDRWKRSRLHNRD